MSGRRGPMLTLGLGVAVLQGLPNKPLHLAPLSRRYKARQLLTYRGDAVVNYWHRTPDPRTEARASYSYELQRALAQMDLTPSFPGYQYRDFSGQAKDTEKTLFNPLQLRGGMVLGIVPFGGGAILRFQNVQIRNEPN